MFSAPWFLSPGGYRNIQTELRHNPDAAPDFGPGERFRRESRSSPSRATGRKLVLGVYVQLEEPPRGSLQACHGRKQTPHPAAGVDAAAGPEPRRATRRATRDPIRLAWPSGKRLTPRRIYASARLARTQDSTNCVSGCAGPKIRRRRWITSCRMVSASSRSSPVLGSKTSLAQQRGSVLD